MHAVAEADDREGHADDKQQRDADGEAEEAAVHEWS
jgi:hypothetical protein